MAASLLHLVSATVWLRRPTISLSGFDLRTGRRLGSDAVVFAASKAYGQLPT